MRLDISEIVLEEGKYVQYDIQEPPLVDEDVECNAPITGSVKFMNSGNALHITGTCETSVSLPCSRCCEYFNCPLTLPIEEQFELRHHSINSRSLPNILIIEEDESPIAGTLFDGHILDLTEMLRQYILLQQPTRPLPPEEEGRCTHCGRKLADMPFLSSIIEDVDTLPILSRLGQLLSETENNRTDDQSAEL